MDLFLLFPNGAGVVVVVVVVTVRVVVSVVVVMDVSVVTFAVLEVLMVEAGLTVAVVTAL